MKAFHSCRKVRFAWAVFALSILFNLTSLIIFYSYGMNSPSRMSLFANVAWAISIITIYLAGSVWLAEETQSTVGIGKQYSHVGGYCIGGTLFIALLVRLSGIDSYGIFPDEFYWLQEVYKLKSGISNSFFGTVGDQPSNFYALFVLLSSWITTNATWAVRLPVVLYSLISLYFAFRFAQVTMGKRAGVACLLLLACSSWDIHNTRFGWHIVNAVAPITSVLLFLSVRIASRCCVTDWLLTGFMLGLAINLGYSEALMVFPVSLAVARAVMNARRKQGTDTQKIKKYCVVLIVTFLLTISPTLLKLIIFPTAFRHSSVFKDMILHISQIGVVPYLKMEGAPLLNRLLYGYRDSVVGSIRGLTLMPWVSVLAGFGILRYLSRISRIDSQLILLSGGLYLVLFFLFTPYQFYREAYLLPLIYISAASGIELGIFIVQRLFSPIISLNPTKIGAMILVLTLIQVLPMEAELHRQLSHRADFRVAGIDEKHCWAMANYVRDNLPPGGTIFSPTHSFCHGLLYATFENRFRFEDYLLREDLPERIGILNNNRSSYAILELQSCQTPEQCRNAIYGPNMEFAEIPRSLLVARKENSLESHVHLKIFPTP